MDLLPVLESRQSIPHGSGSGRTERRVLLLVSSDVESDQLSPLTRPKRDYQGLAEALSADIFDIGTAKHGRFGRLLFRMLGKGPAHAIMARRRLSSYDVVFSDSEHVGLFLG